MAGELTGGIIKWAADKLSTLLPPPSATSPPPPPPSSSDSPNANNMKDLRKLERTMNRIQTLLIEAGDRDIRDRSEMLRLRELKEVAMDAEDLVEDYSYQVLHAKIQTRNRMYGKEKSEEVITDLSSIVVLVPVPEEMAVRVRMIRERFDEIVKEWESLRWMESDGARRRGLDTERSPPSSSLLLEPFVHGRCQDKENVIEFLLKEDDNSDNNGAGCVCVLPIVGMGGVGKTTLAQSVYNDLRVSQHFDMKGWVWVSEEFDVKSLTEIIVTSLTKKPCGPMQLNDLQIILSEKIKGKKFLLVLDDVWNERPNFWHSFRSPFLHSLLSKVIVTTRSEKVARIMQTIPFYPLHCLDFGNSWRLFMQVAFENQDPGEHGNLVQIGKKITMKCGGLPLAIKAIGCALHFEMDVEVWIDILESDIWESEAGRNEVLPALQLSYNCMPTQLKQCFMFLSLFPKDYVFFKDMIIKLWASLGFLNSKGTKSMKDIGTIYFDDLQQRSMVKKVQYDEKTCFYVMHDLVHKLAEFVAGELFARKENSYLNAKPFYTRFVRYLNVVVNDLPKNIDLVPIQQLDSLRFLQVLNTANQWMSKDITINFHSGFFENLKYLRAVDFSYTGITDLPDSIGNLKQLHYLGLTKTDIKYLPESVCLLYNLQSLDLLGCPLQMLPRDIRNLVNLQHLNIAKWSSVSIPRGIGHLTNLITLPAFHMDGYSSCEISELRNLKYIQGGLCITGLGNVRDFTDVVLANLQNKKQITCLTLDWSSDKPETQNHSSNLLPNPSSSEFVLEALMPQENLQMLEIYRYPGLTYPRWLGDVSYTKLVEIVLFGNREISSSFLPSLGRLPFLRNLSIQCMLNVNCVGHEFCLCSGEIKGFRSLNTLEFKYMPRWVQWWGIENGEFCSLNILKIVRCNALKFMPPSISMSLSKLVVNHCKELMKLPNLPSLTSLILMGQLNKHLFANLYFHSLKSLEIGFSHNIRTIALNPFFLKSLEVLVIKSCKTLEYVIGLHNFTSLKELDLDGCPCLTLSKNNIPPFLQFLRLTNCPQIADISNFGNESQKIKEAIDEEQDVHEYEDIDITTEKNDEPPWNDLWGDSNDYGVNWLLSISKQLQEDDKKEYPTTSRKRDRNSLLENPQNGSYKGKEKVEYSSGSSFGVNDSELGSFGGTSEEEFGW